MKISRELMNKAGIKPKLRLANKKTGGGVVSTGPHRVKLISDRIIRSMDREAGKVIEFVEYTIEENGEQKIYKTRLRNKSGDELSYLVQRLGELAEGAEVILECKRAGIQNYIEVTPVGGSEHVEVDNVDEDAEEAVNEQHE